jgi:fatty acid desaturase
MPDGGRVGEGPVDFGPLARLSADQSSHPWHAAQHLYFFLLFPLELVVLGGSSLAFALTGRYRGNRVAAPRPAWVVRQVTECLAVPVTVTVLALVRHPPSAVVAVAAVALATGGIAVSLVLCVEIVHRGSAMVPAAGGPDTWARWQADVAMTVDTPHRLVRWFVGDLNFHTEHHLFPRAPMWRLRELAPIVEQTCVDHGVAYHRYPSFPASWACLFRYLRTLGQADWRSARSAVASPAIPSASASVDASAAMVTARSASPA